MAEVFIPNEIKRLIFEYLDLDSIKNLRQVSSSWAAVGCELLLLPTFGVKSYSVDIPRLISIGSSPELSRQAVKVVKTIAFGNINWDPRSLRRIVWNRPEHRSNYGISDIEPTNQNANALDELDSIIEQQQQDEIRTNDIDALALALRQVPQIDTIHIDCPNIFKHMVFEKVWDKHKLQKYTSTHLGNHSSQLVSLLLASRNAGLRIRHLYHGQLCSSFFTAQKDPLPNDIYSFFGELQSLGLVIYDSLEGCLTHQPIITGLRKVLSSLSCLESLSVKFATAAYLPLDLPQLPLTSRLHDLWLTGIFLESVKLFSFLEQQGCAVQRLSISCAWLRGLENHDTWRAFLEDLRDRFGPQLRKFQLFGMNEGGPTGERWLLWPIYKHDWTDETRADRTELTRKIEEFVVRNGPWPMENDLPGFAVDDLPMGSLILE
jgi:hypothetical protein